MIHARSTKTRTRVETVFCAFLCVFGLTAVLFLPACGNAGGGTGGAANPSAQLVESANSISTTPVLASGGTAISGLASFEHLTWNQFGLTNAITNNPIRNAKVEVVQNGAVVASTSTDASGGYSIASLSVTGTVYVRVLSAAAAPYSATVTDTSFVYAVRSGDILYNAGDSWQANIVAGHVDVGSAFNILDDLIRAQEVGSLLSGGLFPNKITGQWYDGFNPGCTCFDAGTNLITIFGNHTDPNLGSDAYDDAVILHEMGHYTAANYSRDTSPGGSHSITGHYPDIELTWSEGWATFFSSMARTLKPITGAGPAQWYVDSTGWLDLAGGAFTFEIDTPFYAAPTNSALMIGADNEQAISNVLWHIFASTGGSITSPYLGLSHQDIWTVFSVNLKQLTVGITFERFWDAWTNIAAYQTHSVAQLAPLLADRKISYAPDIYEAAGDNTILTARTISKTANESHTFFPAGDKDYFKINVTSGSTYRFATYNLGDGADTMMTLFDSDGVTQLAQNDDVQLVSGGGCAPTTTWSQFIGLCISIKSSQISWTYPIASPVATKTVYLLVEPYRPYVPGDLLYVAGTSHPPAIVEYGSYSLVVN